MGVFCSSVSQDEVAIVENCGAFGRVGQPGCICLPIPFVHQIAGRLSTRIAQLDCEVETKTRDNVFVQVRLAVQYCVQSDDFEKIYAAFYSLTDQTMQIKAYVFNTIRATVPLQNLDEVFESKDELAKAVRDSLSATVDKFGLYIVQTLVTDITPNHKVKRSMNEINANKRLRVAAMEKGEMEKIRLVKAAEAEAEGLYLQGLGISRQRGAIIDGLKGSVKIFAKEQSMNAREVMDMVVLTQYCDTLKDLGNGPNAQAIYLNMSADKSLSDEIRYGMLQAS
eukprot:GHVL01010207.1.p1 GENE.GHVL01010207.1~~GHVL01010207.1.p1  ORF type:complete len:281 (+),score=32.92 GHVL01010207.1:82-924(+)